MPRIFFRALSLSVLALLATSATFAQLSFITHWQDCVSTTQAAQPHRVRPRTIVTTFFGGSIPTGSYSNGSTGTTIRLTLALGKGYRRADFQSTIGTTLPVANANKLGRPIAWNTALQYKVGEHLLPEVESNTTFFEAGPHDGNTQNFITPGMIGHWAIHHRLGTGM